MPLITSTTPSPRTRTAASDMEATGDRPSTTMDKRPGGATGLPVRVSKGGARAPVGNPPATARAAASQAAAAAAATGEVLPLVVTIETPEQLEEVLARFAAEQKQGKPAILVSGASVNGSMTAAMAAREGANVLVVERRDGFSRNNIFALKEEAVYAMASLSPDGALIKGMHDAGQLNFRESRIKRTAAGALQLVPSPEHRFGDWLLPGERGKGLPSMIPVLHSNEEATPAFLDKPVPKAGEKKARPQAEHLDLAEDVVAGAMDPAQWRYANLGQLSDASLAISQTRHMEAGLNHFIAGQPGVEILKGEVDVVDAVDHFVPRLTMAGLTIAPDFQFDLVHIAEGARSKNATQHIKRVGTDFGETWFQRNFHVEPRLEAGSSLVANKADPTNPGVIPIRFNHGQDTVVNVAHLASRSDNAEQVWARNARLTQDVLKAAGSEASAEDPSIRSYDSGPIAVEWKRACSPAKMNMALGGDAAANKSPSAGAGASLAASAYPEMTRRLMAHPGFTDPERRDEANAAYNRQARQVSDVWEDKSVRLMRSLGRLPDEALTDIRANSGREGSLKGED